jgi:hypothetical protein
MITLTTTLLFVSLSVLAGLPVGYLMTQNPAA